MNSNAKHRSLGSTTVEYALIVAIVIAMTIGATQAMRPQLTLFFQTAVTQLGGFLSGGSDDNGATNQNTGTYDTIKGVRNNPANAENDSGWNTVWNGIKQVGGVAVGVGEGVWDIGVGLYSLGKDINSIANPAAFITNPENALETIDKYKQVGVAIWNDPGEVAYTLVEPIHTDWKNGNYGEAIGRGGLEIISMIVAPTKLGKVGKAGDIAADAASAANKLDEVSGAANAVNKVVDTANAAKNAAKEPNRIYSARELKRRAENPRTNNTANPNHNFPESFNAEIFKGKKTIVSDNYHLYTKPGTLNGRPGIYEIGVRPSASGRTEVITHRFFNPSKK